MADTDPPPPAPTPPRPHAPQPQPPAHGKPARRQRPFPWRAIFLLIWRATRGGFRVVVIRGYAIGVVVLVLWLSGSALLYLTTSLVGSGPPPQVVEIPTRPDASMLRADASQFAGLVAAENPRPPLSHYHQLGGWFQPDAYNDCTRSGCHSPLPHRERKENRAFLNMHATSLHCGLCHMTTDAEPPRWIWYDLQSGAATDPPALLRAYDWLVRADAQPDLEWGAADRDTIAALMAEATADANNDAALVALTRHFRAVRPRSPSFRTLVREARQILPNHFRGEYGSKLALTDGRSPVLGHPDTEGAIQYWLANGTSLSGDPRERALAAVHTRRRASPRTCTDCHDAAQTALFQAAGYPAARVEGLMRPTLMVAIEHIMAGRTFHMPTFVEPNRAAPMDEESP
jgi:hypothetical protein